MNILVHYFEWLCNKVGYNEDYDALLCYLFNRDYKWVMDMDENRCQDGLWQRRMFMEQEGVRGDPFNDKPCSILEMLVALAVRLEDDVMGDPDLCVFWRMIHNLGLDETGSEDMWDTIISGWMSRGSIDYDGSGGLFPLRHPRQNQRDVEIWGQAMDYLNELCEV